MSCCNWSHGLHNLVNVVYWGCTDTLVLQCSLYHPVSALSSSPTVLKPRCGQARSSRDEHVTTPPDDICRHNSSGLNFSGCSAELWSVWGARADTNYEHMMKLLLVSVSLSVVSLPRTQDRGYKTQNVLRQQLPLLLPGWGGNINVNCKKHWSKIINNDAIFWEIYVQHCHYSPQHSLVSQYSSCIKKVLVIIYEFIYFDW